MLIGYDNGVMAVFKTRIEEMTVLLFRPKKGNGFMITVTNIEILSDH